MAVKSQEERSSIPANRREYLHLKQLSAIQASVKACNMLDKDAWVDFIMKLDNLAKCPQVYVRYTPYSPDAEKEEDRGFKAFLQVSDFSCHENAVNALCIKEFKIIFRCITYMHC